MLTPLSHLAQVGEPFSYVRESWLMEKDEKMQLVPNLHLQGNSLVREKCYHEASVKYKEAVLLLRTIQSRVIKYKIQNGISIDKLRGKNAV